MTRQKLTVICGNAGVGKTTLGKRSAAESGALLLDIDTVSERLVVAGLAAQGADPDDRDSPHFKRTFRQPIHETLVAIADQNLDVLPCVIVAPLTQERRDPTFLQSLQARMNCPIEVVYVWCPDEVRRRRIEKRDNPRDKSKLQNWEAYAKQGQDPNGRPPFEHTFVDSSAPSK